MIHKDQPDFSAPGGNDGDDPGATSCQQGGSSPDSSPPASAHTHSQEEQGASKAPPGPRGSVSMQEMRQVQPNRHMENIF